MGLSSSQGRLLMLTSRLSDIELGQIMISQRQNQLAWESEKVAKEYNDALNNYKLTIKVNNPEDGKAYREDLNYQNMTQMGYLLTDSKERLYLTKDENGEWIVPTDMDGKELLSIDQSTGMATLGGKEYEIADGTNYYNDSDLLQNSVMNGLMFIFDSDKAGNGINLSMLEADVNVEYVLDTSDDAQAQSKYDYESARLARQDNRLDMDMKQLDTQHEAVAKEYDSVKELIKTNVDRTFQLFKNG